MEEAKQTAATEQYFVVLKSDSLNAPAIFLSFEDCSFYIDQEENELPVEYRSFDTLDEATAYLKLSVGANETNKKKSVSTTQAGLSTKLSSQSKNGTKRRRKSTEDETPEFDQMMKQLKEKKENGTAIRHNTKLQGWISKQRKEYQSYKQNEESTMTPHRIVQLAKHGFNFEGKKKLTWDERAVQWLEYRSKTGEDPKRYSSGGLGKWVLDQRKKYKMLKNGEKTNLTEDQVQMLTEWGFSWDNKIKVPPVIAERKPWEYRFQQLFAFKKHHGHTIVPQTTPELGHWVRSQRSDYGKLLKGQTCGMTMERLQKLNSIGFVFHTAKGSGKKDPMMVPDNVRPEIGVNDGEALEAENDLRMVDEDMARNPLHIQRQNLQQNLTHEDIHMQHLSAWDRFNSDSGKHLA